MKARITTGLDGCGEECLKNGNTKCDGVIDKIDQIIFYDQYGISSLDECMCSFLV